MGTVEGWAGPGEGRPCSAGGTPHGKGWGSGGGAAGPPEREEGSTRIVHSVNSNRDCLV